jgi:hypothetical protein
VCARFVPAGGAGFATLRPDGHCTEKTIPHTDCRLSEEFREDRFAVGGRRAVVERALVSGTFVNLSRQRQIVIRLDLGGDTRLDLSGAVGDDDGYSELLLIASAVNPR